MSNENMKNDWLYDSTYGSNVLSTCRCCTNRFAVIIGNEQRS